MAFLLSRVVVGTGEASIQTQVPTLAQVDASCLAEIDARATCDWYAKGVPLFSEEEIPNGAYVILEGEVKLTIFSAEGKSLGLGFFGPGTVLGLESAVLGWRHVVTAETIRPTRALYLDRHDFLRHMEGNKRAAHQIAKMLGQNSYYFLNRIRALELAKSAEEKLISFLLMARHNDLSQNGNGHFKVELSQETIAQMIGTSRETVARLLARLKRRGLLDWKRARIFVHDAGGLEKVLTLRRQ